MATDGVNETLRALLAEYGLTEELLAEAANERALMLFGRYGNATGRSVRYWLSGQVRWPHPYYLLPLEEIFGRPALELGFVPRGKCSLPVLAATRRRVAKLDESPTGQELSVLRREFFVVAAGTLLDIGVTPLPASGRIGMATAATVRDTTRRLGAYDDLHGGAGLADVAERYVTHVQDAMGRCTYSPRVEAALYEATGELATSAGWFCFDGGDMARARRFFETAMTQAHLADSPVLKAWVLSHMSRQAIELRQGNEAVTMARRALESTRKGRDPRLSALLHGRMGVGYACQGEAGRSSRAMVLAEKALDRAGDPPAWLAFCGPDELLGQASRTRYLLGRPDEAVHLVRQALAIRPAAFQRNRFSGIVRLAVFQLSARHVPDAAASGNEALNLLPSVRSGRLMKELADLRGHLEPYRRDTHVSAFIERYDASLPAA
jgi:tetratricopeptide (TPR) repeat protein